MAPRAVYPQFNTVRYYQCLCSCLCNCQRMYLLIPVIKTRSNASFTRPGFRLAGSFWLSPHKVVKLIASIRLFTQPGLQIGREFTGRLPGKSGASHCCSRSPPGGWITVCTCCLETRSHTPVFSRLQPSGNVPLQFQQSTGAVRSFWDLLWVVKMSDVELDINYTGQHTKCIRNPK